MKHIKRTWCLNELLGGWLRHINDHIDNNLCARAWSEQSEYQFKVHAGIYIYLAFSNGEWQMSWLWESECESLPKLPSTLPSYLTRREIGNEVYLEFGFLQIELAFIQNIQITKEIRPKKKSKPKNKHNWSKSCRRLDTGWTKQQTFDENTISTSACTNLESYCNKSIRTKIRIQAS